ncbi:tetratricopeptide repeat protein [Streptomyces californicus]|uniref:tetratricopeptide repeat protein n=1 Tax=Streptomyces californicus TaxID=67351 RepID=UPI0037FAC662
MGAEGESAETRNEISGGQLGHVIMAREISGAVTFHMADRRVPAYLQDPSRWPLAGEWEALAAGVHRARTDDSGDAVTPYVPRDQDHLIRTRLRRAADTGGLVLVVGDSTAGKTRACFEALQAELPDYRVLAPTAGSDLVAAIEVIARSAARCAVWLDDLELYLGPQGLEPGLVAEFVRQRIPVLATMRHQQFEVFATLGDIQGVGAERVGWVLTGARVLRQLEVVDLARIWTSSELERAGEADDDRIADALTHHGPYGLAEYLAAGPALLQEWHRAARPGGHPRAAALIAAAVDLARTGLAPPYTRSLLTEAHEPYLTAAGGPLLRPESLDTAMTWASRRRHGATSMLTPTEDPDAWGVFDYLTDHTDTRIPDTLWHTALQHATSTNELTLIGGRAHEVAPGIAEASYRRAVEAGDSYAMVNLGILLSGTGREEEAEGFYRQAVEAAGHSIAMFNLGSLLSEAGREEEAASFYRQAADAGDSHAMVNLGNLLFEAGREEEAERFYRQAVEAADHSIAMVNLGRLLLKAGRKGEAESFYRQAADAGDSDAMARLGTLLSETGRREEAEGFYRQAVQAGDSDAMFSLGYLLSKTGRGEEAEGFYRQAVQAGDSDAMVSLGILLSKSGRLEEAESFYRQAADAGEISAMFNLGILLTKAGRAEEAESFYRQAADAGDNRAMFNLGVLLFKAGRLEEAEGFYRQAADAGEISATINLGILLSETGRGEEAEGFYRQAVEAGKSGGMVGLGNLLFRAGREDEAEDFYRRAVEAGEISAMFNLGILLNGTGRAEEAEGIYQRAEEAGGAAYRSKVAAEGWVWAAQGDV